MFYLARAEAKRKRAHGSMCGCVAITAAQGQARLCETKFRADDVHDALELTVEIE